MKKMLLFVPLIIALGRPAFADFEEKQGKFQEKILHVCANDIGINCQGLDFDTGLYSCLKAHHEILNDDCKHLFDRYNKFLHKHHHDDDGDRAHH